MLKKLINNYAFEKFKHLELSDTILEHSQIFSDSIQILQALGQAISIRFQKNKSPRTHKMRQRLKKSMVMKAWAK